MSYNLGTGSGSILTSFAGVNVYQPVALAPLLQGVYDQRTVLLATGGNLTLYTFNINTNVVLGSQSGLNIWLEADNTGAFSTPFHDHFWAQISLPDDTAPLPSFTNGAKPKCTFDLANSSTGKTWGSINSSDHTLIDLDPGYYRLEWSLDWLFV